MKTGDFDKRMKEYEYVSRHKLIKKLPVIVRADGRAFHTFTRKLDKPFDPIMVKTMQDTLLKVCSGLSGCVFGYTQSDELTFVLTDYKTRNTAAFFDYVQSKVETLIASDVTGYFNEYWIKNVEEAIKSGKISEDKIKIYRSKYYKARFDARAFNSPLDEVQNQLYWRQLDATKNSISSLGQSQFSHKELYKMNSDDIQEMLWKEKGINWNNLDTSLKRGSCCIRIKSVKKVIDKKTGEEVEKVTFPWIIDSECPIFTKDWDYINDRVKFKGDFGDEN